MAAQARREVYTYELSELLGIDVVPRAEMRRAVHAAAAVATSAGGGGENEGGRRSPGGGSEGGGADGAGRAPMLPYAERKKAKQIRAASRRKKMTFSEYNYVLSLEIWDLVSKGEVKEAEVKMLEAINLLSFWKDVTNEDG